MFISLIYLPSIFKVTVSIAYVETAFILCQIVCMSRSPKAVSVNKYFLVDFPVIIFEEAFKKKSNLFSLTLTILKISPFTRMCFSCF